MSLETLIINLNPALDRTAIVEKYNPYGPNKAKRIITLPGGKGQNVGKALKNLGYTNFICTGFLGGNIGEKIKEMLDQEGIPNDFFWINGETRIAYATYEETTGIGIITNEPGPEITIEEINKFINFIKAKYLTVKTVVLSGGVPPVFHLEKINELMWTFKNNNKELFIDTSNELLKSCVEIGPFCLKINENELEDAFKIDINRQESLISFYLSLHKLGTEWLIITRGEKGALFISEEGILVGKHKRIHSHYAIGSGDAFMAGIIYGRAKNLNFKDILKLAMACGGANTLKFGACIFNIDDVEKIKDEIIIETVKIF